ncbi:MAG TPA: hypothetical protein VFL82_09265 [Thermomicrobiales bacterium]|jgi:hypothetical protein|nr:hypothetical protein [Thermomicrobiales bacterium]
MPADTAKDELHHLVDQLEDVDVNEALDYLHWLLSEEDELSPEEIGHVQRGEEEIARGEFVTLQELRRSLGR